MHKIEEIKPQINKRIIKLLLTDKYWTRDQDMLRLIGNSIWIINTDSLNLIMNEILNEYSNIEEYSLNVQKRVASIYINYLHALYKYQNENIASKYLKWLTKLSAVPELTLFKMLTLYYEALFAKNNQKAKEIIKPLKMIVPKIIRYLPVK